MIVHFRVDSRVIHGQTTTRITKECPIDGAIIVDDEIAADKFMAGVYGSALGSARLFAFSEERALEKLPEAERSTKRYLVVLKSPEVARRLVENGYRIGQPLNLGPQPNREGATMVARMFYLTKDEEEALDYLEGRGIELIVNPMLTTPHLTWSEAKRRAGEK